MFWYVKIVLVKCRFAVNKSVEVVVELKAISFLIFTSDDRYKDEICLADLTE